MQRELEKIVKEMLPRDEARKSIQRRRSLLTKRTDSSDEMLTVAEAFLLDPLEDVGVIAALSQLHQQVMPTLCQGACA